MKFIKKLSKGVGLAGTLALAFAAFAPKIVSVPISMRPWVFITFIFWFVFYSSGMFSL